MVIASCSANAPQPPIITDKFTNFMPIDGHDPYPAVAACKNDMAIQKQVLLPIPLMSQHTPYANGIGNRLCWAASIAMVSTALGNPRTTCYVASAHAFDGQNCCRFTSNDGSEQVASCSKGIPVYAMHSILRTMGIHDVYVNRALESGGNNEELRYELSQGRPVIAQIEEAESWTVQNTRVVTSNHLVVIIGYSGETFVVNDPDTFPQQYWTYAQLTHGFEKRPWKWVGTWYQFSFRQDGCNPLYNPHCDCK